MNPDNQEFQDLQRLLKLKRYEQPPPRYFNDFSAQVLSGIRSSSAADRSAMEAVAWEAPWLQRFLAIFERKPILAGAFGVAVCGLLIGGAVYSERMAMPEAGAGFAATPSLTPTLGVTPVAGLVNNSVLGTSSTNPVSLFDSIPSPNAQWTSGRPLGQ